MSVEATPASASPSPAHTLSTPLARAMAAIAERAHALAASNEMEPEVSEWVLGLLGVHGWWDSVGEG